MIDRIGRFRSDDSRANFLRAFGTAMAAWPDHTDHRVETRFGSTMVSMTRRVDDRPPLVLLQGGGSTVAVWARFADAWRRDRQVIAIDTVWDAGRSVQTHPVADGADAAVWLDETLSGLKVDHAHVVGYSYGGWVALNQVAVAPSRIRSVTAIEPPNTITAMPLPAWWRMVRMLVGDEHAHRAYLAWVRGDRLPESAMLELLLSARGDFMQRGSPRPRRLSKEQWRGLRTPTMVMLGGRSRLVVSRAAGAVVRRRASHAELQVLPGSRHAVLVDAPDVVVDRVGSFVRRHDSEGR